MAINKENHIREMDMFKTEIIEDTIRNLLEENDGTFDLTTPKGIQWAVDYMVDYLMLHKIEVDTIKLKSEVIRHLPKSKS
mgnify:CR=1 FL=1